VPSTKLNAPTRSYVIHQGSYSSVGDLEAKVYDRLAQHNEVPKRFRWSRSAQDNQRVRSAAPVV